MASDKKGEDIVLLDMRPVSPMADYFIILSGNSERQLKAILDHMAQETKEQHNILPWRIEGEAANGWVLIDYGDVVVHAFLPEKRDYYDLEGLWRDAPILVRMQ